MNKYKTKIAILAAGKGIRMAGTTPKAVVPLNGKPMISHIIESLEDILPLDDVIVVVSRDNKNEIKDSLRQYKGLNFCIQEEALGTGDAVKSVLHNVNLKSAKNLLVLLADHPLIKKSTLRKLLKTHNDKKSVLTMLTSRVPDYQNIYKYFYFDGRIVRDQHNEISEILEPNELSEKQMLRYKEINPSIYLFDIEWLKTKIKKIKINKDKNEYYLTHLIGMAVKEGIKINSITVDARESFGINTKEQLIHAEEIISKNLISKKQEMKDKKAESQSE